MPCLDQKISEWRQQMLAAGIESPVPLEEMEIHLHEDIREQMRSGLNEQEAFEISVQNIGQPKQLKNEFAKTERLSMKMIKIGAGIVGLLVGLAFVMPAVAQCQHEGAMNNQEVVLYTLGMAMCIGGAFLALLAFKKRKA
jgi:hypothetical protein